MASAALASQAGARGGLAAYAAFGLPLTMTALPINILLPDFYAAQTGLALSTIGLVLLATRLVDAVVDPLLGTWVDRQKRYLTPIFLACVPLAVGFVGLFSPPAFARAMPMTWLAATLVAAYLGYSLAIVAYQAWGAGLALDDAGRARVTASREGAGLIGVLLGGSVPALAGMPVLISVFLVLLAVGLFLLARHAPRIERAAHAARNGSDHANPFAAFLVPLGTTRLRWLLAVFALNAIAPAITATVFQFFVADRLGLADKAALFLSLYFVAGAASMPLWSRLARHLSLHAVWLIGMVAAVLAFVWAFALGAGSLGAFATICVLSGLAFGADLALPPALLARVIDANGHRGRREGAYFGLWNCVNKFCLALAAGVALPLLEALGYTRGATHPQALTALAAVYAVLPCLLKLVAATLLFVAWRREKF